MSHPTSLDELMDIVNQYSDNMEEEEIKKACKKIRARACIETGGGTYEYKLKKMKRSVSKDLNL
jgi:hypothetical protein